MLHRLTLKLERFARLSRSDLEALGETVTRQREVMARQDLVREREAPGPLRVILKGWACRYKQLEDGRRQIVAICLPGDVYGAYETGLDEMDHSIGALTPMTIAEVSAERLTETMARFPMIGTALACEAQVAISIQREWTTSLGQRGATERLGHLFCELYARLDAIGLTQGDAYEMPLRQTDLGAVTGLTCVHVNRSLMALRAQNLIVLQGRRLTISNMDLLRRMSLFDAHYLHLGRVGRNSRSHTAEVA